MESNVIFEPEEKLTKKVIEKLMNVKEACIHVKPIAFGFSYK